MKTLTGRKLNVCFLLIALMMIVACQKNEDDQLLKDQLIGTWKSTNSSYKSYTFNEDNTFIDTAFYLYSDNPFAFRVLEVISGDYQVDNGHLSFSNIQLIFYNGLEYEYSLGSSTTYDPDFIISFDGDILVLTQEDIFESVNKSNSGIVGKWSHDKLVAVYDKRLENKSFGGTVHGIYDFLPDLNVKWQYETSYDNVPYTYNSTAVYNMTDSKLSINQWSLYNLNVSFTKNKMIWTYSDKLFQRK